MKMKILIVDDDALLRRSLGFQLEKAAYEVYTAGSAEDALASIQNNAPDLVLLDIGLPGMDGLDALERIRTGFQIPVIFLTARRRELDEALGLELGADDYITKPFDTAVILARIKAVLRRSRTAASLLKKEARLLVAGDMVIDPGAHSLFISGKSIELAPLEFKLLQTLAQNAGRVLSADDLLKRVWGPEYVGQPQVVYVHLRGLRLKIEENPNRPRRIVTIRGVGYKLVVQEEA